MWHEEHRRPVFRKFRRERRLSKSKRENWKAITYPMKWQFSTSIAADISPDEEERLIREFEQKEHAKK